MWRDEAYLLDMLLYARKARDINAGITLASFQADEVRRLATLHVLQIVGEAASKISKEYTVDHPQIAWGRITGLRHRLVHDYPRIELPKVWTIVQVQIPALIAELESLVPPDTSQPA